VLDGQKRRDGTGKMCIATAQSVIVTDKQRFEANYTFACLTLDLGHMTTRIYSLSLWQDCI